MVEGENPNPNPNPTNPNPKPNPSPNLALTRWALIASYRDASVDDTCRVFPRPRAVLRRKCKALGQQTVISPISRPYLAHISPISPQVLLYLMYSARVYAPEHPELCASSFDLEEVRE